MTDTRALFAPDALIFLQQLRLHNHREWFNEHKEEYEKSVRTPALALIEEMGAHLPSFAPHFRAIAKKSGGSLMRVYRDTRLSKDKMPYKTNIGIQFLHELGKDVHAPGYYLHIEPEECFLGVGIWHPESKALGRIRNFIADNPIAWQEARDYSPFASHFSLVGDSLVRPPKRFNKDHPLLTDLKRKDFIALQSFAPSQVEEAHFVEWMVEQFKTAQPLISYL